jgi:hypothetical protein
LAFVWHLVSTLALAFGYLVIGLVIGIWHLVSTWHLAFGGVVTELSTGCVWRLGIAVHLGVFE